MTTSIGFLGLGAMGGRMAAHLVGHEDIELTVWNRSVERARPLVEKGARRATSPREAVAGRDIVISMLSDDAACEAVWGGGEHPAIDALDAGTLVMESSTVSPEWIGAFDAALGRRGAALIDAPVVGSRPQAEAAQLIFLVGGEEEHVARAEPVMRRMGSAIHHTGPIGTGAVVKLFANTLFAVQVATFGELLEAGKRVGLEPTRLQSMLASLPMVSPAAAGASSLLARDQHDPLFPIELVTKDLGYASQLVRPADHSHSLTEAAFAAFDQAMAVGLSQENITAVVKLYRGG